MLKRCGFLLPCSSLYKLLSDVDFGWSPFADIYGWKED